MNLKNDKPQVVLVTGGSRGIGAATVQLAARQGYSVAVNYMNSKTAAARVVNDAECAGAGAIAVQADISSEADVLRMFEQVDERFGRIDALVNNAGILAPLATVADLEFNRVQRIFAVNAIGSLLCAREAVRRMSKDAGGNGGAIVNVSSGAARLGGANQYVDYAASKGAIDTLTKGLSLEVADQGIRVNAVRPGFIDTDMHHSVRSKDQHEAIRSAIPLRRTGTAEEIASAILWLLSDDAAYCTGTIVDVTGGR